MKKITKENRRSILNRYIPNRITANIIPNNENIENREIMTVNIFNPILDSENRKEINKWEKITDKGEIFISFVSDPPGSDFYSSRAEILVNTLNNLGYDYCVVHFENDRNYYQNCCFKPSFILKKMREFNKDIVWIDGDTYIKRSMEEFIKKDKDFDIGLVTYNKDMTGFVASPLFLRNTEITLELIEKWSNHCKEKVESGICELDHDAIKHVILPSFREKIRIRLNWDENNNFHNGDIINNVNSNVPFKNEILARMVLINRNRPCNYTKQDYIII
jgi:hypothetical protein